ncbi:unnamed protein product [Paramecium pentaurelia]|uniref:Uncharacterized protein n=1 Tax=Paramecium pentaurelia TaxID=43138 RepID=A0A8S1XE29_9CILI|nr:unnamed protein product [Paramecium pentaurelia]
MNMHKEFIKGKLKKDDLIVITNPPWGRTVNLDKFNKMIKFLETNCNQCYLLIASDQFQFFDKRKWELLAEPLVGGQWTKIIKYDRNRETQLITLEIVPKENNQIITQSTTIDVIAKDLSYQRDIEEYENKKIVDLTKNLGALSKKLNNQDYLKHLKKETRTVAERYAELKQKQDPLCQEEQMIYIRQKQEIQIYKQTKLESKLKRKKQNQRNKKQILIEIRRFREKLKILDEKAKKKSLKLLKQQKKRSQTIPRW